MQSRPRVFSLLTDSAFYDILKQTTIFHLSKANPKWSCPKSSLPVAKKIVHCSDHEDDYLLLKLNTVKNEIRQQVKEVIFST